MSSRISLCLIVKNEAANLPACLGSAADLVDEIIVVDTGSTDQTRQEAARLGAKVYDFAWCDDFAAARNESLRHATGDWILWLDGDERFDEDNRQRLRTLRASLPNELVAYMMKQASPQQTAVTNLGVDQARLFPNHPQIRWRYRVHEQIIPAIEKLGGTLRPTDIVIRHTGYLDPDLRRRKNERNLRLLQLEIVDHPDDPVVLFHLGWALVDLGRAAEAVPRLQQSLARSWPGLSSVRKAYALLVNAQYALGQKQEALANCTAGRSHFPEDAELLFIEGVLRTELRDPAGAEACLLRYLAGDGRNAENYRGKARYHLGEIYAGQGRTADAEAQWRATLEEQRDYTDAWLRLGELWTAQGRWAQLTELENAAARLETDPQRCHDALALRVWACLGRKEFAAAEQITRTAIARAPQALLPRMILSHVLLQEGRDWNAAEQALHDILAQDPNNASARHNLAVLRKCGKHVGRPVSDGSDTQARRPAAGSGDTQLLRRKGDPTNMDYIDPHVSQD